MSIFLKRALAPLLLSLFALPSIGATPPPRLAVGDKLAEMNIATKGLGGTATQYTYNNPAVDIVNNSRDWIGSYGQTKYFGHSSSASMINSSASNHLKAIINAKSFTTSSQGVGVAYPDFSVSAVGKIEIYYKSTKSQATTPNAYIVYSDSKEGTYAEIPLKSGTGLSTQGVKTVVDTVYSFEFSTFSTETYFGIIFHNSDSNYMRLDDLRISLYEGETASPEDNLNNAAAEVQAIFNDFDTDPVTAIDPLPVTSNGATINYVFTDKNDNPRSDITVNSSGVVSLPASVADDNTIVNVKANITLDGTSGTTVSGVFYLTSHSSLANSYVTSTLNTITQELNALANKTDVTQATVGDDFALTVSDSHNSVITYEVKDKNGDAHGAVSVNPTTGKVTINSAHTDYVDVTLKVTVSNDLDGETTSQEVNHTITFKVKSNLSYSQAKVDTALITLNSFIDGIDVSNDIYNLSETFPSTVNDCDVAWTSTDDDLAYIDGDGKAVITIDEGGQVTLTGTITYTHTGGAYSDEQASATVTLTFNVPANNAAYSVNFIDYPEYDYDEETVNGKISGGESLDLSNFTPFKKGKVFAGWVEVGNEEAGVVSTVLVNKDYTFKATFSDNYVSSNTDSSLKLDFAKTVKQEEYDITDSDEITSNVSTSYKDLINTSDTLVTDYDDYINFDSSIFNFSAKKNSSSTVVRANSTGIALYSGSNNGNEITFALKNANMVIKSISAELTFSTANPFPISIWTEKATLLTSETLPDKNSTIDALAIEANSFTIKNMNTAASGNVAIKKLIINYATGEKGLKNEVEYNVSNKTGIRFGTTFDITGKTETQKFGDMGTLIIPKWILDDENISIIDYFLTKGVRGVESDSLLIEIKADNVDDSEENELTFSGVLTNLPSSLYDVDLVGICYYEYDGQIYFSHEKTDSLHDIAQSLIQAGGYNEYVLAALSQI